MCIAVSGNSHTALPLFDHWASACQRRQPHTQPVTLHCTDTEHPSLAVTRLLEVEKVEDVCRIEGPDGADWLESTPANETRHRHTIPTLQQSRISSSTRNSPTRPREPHSLLHAQPHSHTHSLGQSLTRTHNAHYAQRIALARHPTTLGHPTADNGVAYASLGTESTNAIRPHLLLLSPLVSAPGSRASSCSVSSTWRPHAFHGHCASCSLQS